MLSRPERGFFESNAVRSSYIDFGGSGPPAVLLHGLYGRALEWRSTAEWLCNSHHVFALDTRGHGMSEKGMADFSRDAQVNDAIAFIERLRSGRAVLIGQSMGGVTAFLVAARRPDLVDRLLIIEATDRGASWASEPWLDRWPLPFASLADAKRFFESQNVNADAWVEVLEEREDGYWPEFRLEDMSALTADIGRAYDYRREWESITCPSLVVGGSRSFIDQDKLREMAMRLPGAVYRCVDGAGHDVHLDNPDGLANVAREFFS